MGKVVNRPAKLDKRLSKELKSLACPDDPYPTIIGKTMATDDFYEGRNLFITCTYNILPL